MSAAAAYVFRAMTPDDLDMVCGWIAEPHVAEWWIDADGAAQLPVAADFDEPDFNMWIVSLDGRPFAYMQDYNPHLYPGHHFYDRIPGTRGIDQFIGVPDMMGNGHGSAIVRVRSDMMLAQGVTCVVTDPFPHNARAIRAYEKAGFTAYGEVTSPQWGPALLMQRLAA